MIGQLTVKSTPGRRGGEDGEKRVGDGDRTVNTTDTDCPAFLFFALAVGQRRSTASSPSSTPKYLPSPLRSSTPIPVWALDYHFSSSLCLKPSSPESEHGKWPAGRCPRALRTGSQNRRLLPRISPSRETRKGRPQLLCAAAPGNRDPPVRRCQGLPQTVSECMGAEHQARAVADGTVPPTTTSQVPRGGHGVRPHRFLLT